MHVDMFNNLITVIHAIFGYLQQRSTYFGLKLFYRHRAPKLQSWTKKKERWKTKTVIHSTVNQPEQIFSDALTYKKFFPLNHQAYDWWLMVGWMRKNGEERERGWEMWKHAMSSSFRKLPLCFGFTFYPVVVYFK